jgi:hypothetical protein
MSLTPLDDEKFREKVLELQKVYFAARDELFVRRLYKMLGKSEHSKLAISSIKFEMTDGDNWCISYVHETAEYSANNYKLVDEEESSNSSKPLTSNMSFGIENGQYFLSGNTIHNSFKIYRNSSGLLRVINEDYSVELDIDEQIELITRYSKCIDIPEYPALRILLFMIENEWDDEDIYVYFTAV